jgi:hypothetical protein
MDLGSSISSLETMHGQVDGARSDLQTAIDNGESGITESFKLQEMMQKFSLMNDALTNMMKATADARKAAIQNMK